MPPTSPHPQPATVEAASFGDCALVVVAAGGGSRFGGYKQLLPVGGIPLVVRTLMAFDGRGFAARLVVLPGAWLGPGAQWETLRGQWPALDAAGWHAVAGGAERAESVAAGVAAVPGGVPLVAVHDGARPFPPMEAVDRAIALLAAQPTLAAAIVASPVTDTIKRVAPGGGELVTATEDRAVLRRAETPQIARVAALVQALARPDASTARDEAEALERAGHPVACVLHQGWNLKVTYPADARLAEFLARE